MVLISTTGLLDLRYTAMFRAAKATVPHLLSELGDVQQSWLSKHKPQPPKPLPSDVELPVCLEALDRLLWQLFSQLNIAELKFDQQLDDTISLLSFRKYVKTSGTGLFPGCGDSVITTVLQSHVEDTTRDDSTLTFDTFKAVMFRLAEVQWWCICCRVPCIKR
jgi:hypothetical protein